MERKIIEALVAFRAEAPVIKFDAVNPFFKSKYATLKAIHKAIDPLLAKHGLAVLQFPISEDGRVGCKTTIIHESGETMEQSFTVPLAKQDPQGAGAALTYARRYGISGALCLITDEDNDGNQEPDSSVANAGKQKPRESKSKMMSKAHRDELQGAAADRYSELGEEASSSDIGEMIDVAAKTLGHSSRIELPDSEFDKVMAALSSAKPVPF